MNNINTGNILIEILIAATLGMFIFASAQTQVNDTLTTMSSQQIEAFNSNFSSFEAEQVGSQVKALLGRLIANGNTYVEEPDKVPDVKIDKVSDTWSEISSVTYNQSNVEDLNTYINNLGEIRNNISTKHKYYVEFGYAEDGLINLITIYYDADTMATGN